MEKFTNDDFCEFMEFYKHQTCEDKYHRIHKCYDNITELSRSDTYQADPLITHPQKMYGLDWIVMSSKLRERPPKSTDALFFREGENGILSLHIIEFKFLGKKSYWDRMDYLWGDILKKISCESSKSDDMAANDENTDINQEKIINDSEDLIFEECEEECFNEFFFDNFKRIKDNFKNPIEVSLQLKAYEVIFITLPLLYEEYCEKNPQVTKKNINAYLDDIDKYYWAFVGNFSQSYTNVKYNKANKLNRYSKRLEMTIFKKASVRPWQDFKNVLKYEILDNPF